MSSYVALSYLLNVFFLVQSEEIFLDMFEDEFREMQVC